MPKASAPPVELVVVGDELLTGLVVDTNSTFLGRELADLGLAPLRSATVGDDDISIRQAVAAACGRAGLVFVSGGLGPTPDDKTLAAVASLTGRRLVVHKPTLVRVERFFRRRRAAMPRLAARQALVPERSRLFPNPAGMVPGIALRYGAARIVLLPGVPVELSSIFDRGVKPWLARSYRLPRIHVLSIRTFGLAEADVAQRARRLFARHRSVLPAFYPSTSGLDLVLRSRDRAALVRCGGSLARLLGTAVYEVGRDPLEAVVGRLLRRRRLRAATAESCTGGLIADRLTDVPGSSGYFLGGIVCYSNAVKTNVLGVRAVTLERRGAVSCETVREMAAGVCRFMGSDVGIAASGIAGPAGGTRAKPVGTVFLGVSVSGRVEVERRLFQGTRRMVKERTASAALDFCRRVLEALR